MKAQFQIFCDRGNGPTLDGCWGSENAFYRSFRDAKQGAASLSELYPRCAWLVMDPDGLTTFYSIRGKELQEAK